MEPGPGSSKPSSEVSLPSSAPRAALLGATLLAGLLAAFAVTSPGQVAAAIQTGDCSPGSSWPAANGSLASQVMALVNQHRAGLGESQLVTSPTLNASAVWKARHMAQFGYFSHDDPGPPTATTPARTVADRIATCGYTASWGENIAEGFQDAQSVLNAWLGSAGHKANIENASYRATGVGVATGSNGAVYWVQDFGTVADGGSPPPPTTTAPPPPPPTTTAATTTTRPTTTTTHSGTTTTSPSTTTPPAATTTTTAQGKQATLRLAVVHTGIKARRLALTTQVSASGVTAPRVFVKCAAHVGGRDLRVVANIFRGSLARCTWRLPQTLQSGAKARGFIKVTLGSLHVQRAFGLKLP